MGKISEYNKVTTVSNSDTFLLEGAEGTKGITAENLSKSIIEMAGNPEAATPDFYAMIDELNNLGLRRNIYRGKNLGQSFTDEQKAQISSAKFKDLFLGDYWQIEGQQWRIVDFNYWMGNSPNLYSHGPHLVIMPVNGMYTAKMNSTATTEGGYVGSEMYTTNLEQAKTIINSAFGETHILKHKEYLTNAVTNGYPSGAAWYDSTVELPNEIMIYGSYVVAPANNGTIMPYRYTIDTTQLALYRIFRHYIVTNDYWLRDVAGNGTFTIMSTHGDISRRNANYENISVRPVFGLIG